MSLQPAFEQSVLAFDHVGIRVSDYARSVRFYERLGFKETVVFDRHEANEMVSPSGVRLNLIFNGTRCTHNTLIDEPIKLPGVTHPAFVIDDMDEFVQWLEKEGITITEGPHPIGERRVTVFIRDPDRNVLEFNQLIAQTNKEQ